jgi:hypothetical protein
VKVGEEVEGEVVGEVVGKSCREEWLPLHHYSLIIINYSLSTKKTKRGNSLAIHGCTELSASLICYNLQK